MSELAVGQLVSIIWEERPGSAGKVPVVQLGGNASAVPTTTVVDRKTIEYGPSGLAVKKGGIGMQHLSFTPALENHTHADSLTQHGWKITDDGVLYTGSTFIHPTGQIVLGSGSDVIKLDSQNATYRLWAGNTTPASAPFSVSKAGAIKATSGQIAGWNLSANQFSADSGQAKLDSSAHPYLGLGGATAFGQNGIWLGKDTADNVYKLYIGNPAGEHMYWDGDKLVITGTFVGIANWTTPDGLIWLDDDGLFAKENDGNEAFAIIANPRTWAGRSLADGDVMIGNETNWLLWDASADSLTGKLASLDVAGNITLTGTVDGVDVSAHAANANAHHSKVHNAIGTDHTITGSKFDLVGLTATNTIGKITPSSNPTGTEAILKTDTNGKLTLAQLDISGDIGIDGSVSSNLMPQTTDTFDIGSPTAMWRKGYLSELDAFVYAENVVSVLGGTQIISKGVGHITSPLTTATVVIMTTASLVAGDYLLFRNGLTVEYMKVASVYVPNLMYEVAKRCGSYRPKYLGR